MAPVAGSTGFGTGRAGGRAGRGFRAEDVSWPTPRWSRGTGRLKGRTGDGPSARICTRPGRGIASGKRSPPSVITSPCTAGRSRCCDCAGKSPLSRRHSDASTDGDHSRRGGADVAHPRGPHRENCARNPRTVIPASAAVVPAGTVLKVGRREPAGHQTGGVQVLRDRGERGHAGRHVSWTNRPCPALADTRRRLRPAAAGGPARGRPTGPPRHRLGASDPVTGWRR